MKFDVIVGNPPYQKSNDDSSFTNLWADFVHKSYSLSNQYLAMITPKTWTNQVTKENNSSKILPLIKNQSMVVNIDECAKYFSNVGSSFSYYILNKNKNSSISKIKTKNFDGVIDWSIVDFIPNDFSDSTIRILNKILNGSYFDYISSSGTVGNVVNTPDKEHPYSIRYSDGTEKWSNEPHEFQYVEKLVFPNQTTKNYPVYAPESAPANRGVFYKIDNKNHADQMIKYIKSPVIQFLISQQRTHHGVLNTSVIKRIPKFDIKSNWTNADLYAHFNLTQEEIDYIESNVN